MKKGSNIVIYQAKSGAIEFKQDISKETIWATQAQIVDLFDVDQSVVSRHVKNIFADGEVSKKSNMQKMHNANSDKPVILYSLDVILAVGYRANSGRAIQFRQWATKTLRSHIVDGYTINKTRIAKNYGVFLKAVEEVKKLLPSGGIIDAASAMELVKMFASTWISLDSYDREALPKDGVTKKKVEFTAEELHRDLEKLKKDLVGKGEATELLPAFAGDKVSTELWETFFKPSAAKTYTRRSRKRLHISYILW